MTKLLYEEEATGKAKEIYEDIEDKFGMVPNIFKAQAAEDVDMLQSNWVQWKSIMYQQKALDQKTKEVIALSVSLAKECEYCFLAHETLALMAGASEQEVIEAKEVVKLLIKWNSIAKSFSIPCDVVPEMAKKK